MSKLPIELVQTAIDALIDLEGSIIYPNGLPSCFCDALARLRKDSTLLQEKAEEAETAAVLGVPRIPRVHLAPKPGSLKTGCCELSVMDLHAEDGITMDMRDVTCPAFDRPPVKQPGAIRGMINDMDKSVRDQADAEAMQTIKECVHAASRRFLRKRYFCKLTVSGITAEHRVRLTSKPYTGYAYVQRLVKSTNRFGSKRYLVKRDDLREELY